MADMRAVPHIIKLVSDRHAFVRMAAAHALGKIGDVDAIEPLLALLSDDNLFVRMAAANAFNKLGQMALEPILKLLANNDATIRRAAAQALGKIGDERAITPLILSLWDENEDVLIAAGEALEKIDPYWYARDATRQYLPYFSEALKKGGKHVKLYFIGILEKIGELGIADIDVADILKDYIKDEDKNIRLSTALALEKIKNVR